MVNDKSEVLIQDLFNQIDSFCKNFDEKFEKQQQQLKACKKKNELDFKLAQEMKTNAELTQRLNDLSHRGDELDRICTNLTCLTIADNDRSRLEKAKESYQLAKELTGIRLDFSAPPDVIKGYVKSEHRKLVSPLCLSGNTDSAPVWEVLRTAAAPGWPAIST